MKKLLVAALVTLVSLALTVPSFALENQFGGYWRTSAITQQDFSGDDSEAQDQIFVDTRSRLYYTAKLNDNLKFVNKFEIDAVWGDDSLGDIGADGKDVEVKNSYVDFGLGCANVKIGIQYQEIARGFIIADDASSLKVTWGQDAISIPFIWIKNFEGGMGPDANDGDYDYYAINPSIGLNPETTVNPFLMYVQSDFYNVETFYLGVNLDAKLAAASAWFTGIYMGGEIADDVDNSGILLAVGGDVDLGGLGVHGQIFHSSGNDDPDDNDGFLVPKGDSYYWAEIMGYGIFDQQVSAGSPGDQIENIMALNLGTTTCPADKLTVTGDLWYAKLDKEDANGEDDLGVELDIKATYELVEDLNLDVVAAYLFAGDATGGGEEDPYELGTMLSLSF